MIMMNGQNGLKKLLKVFMDMTGKVIMYYLQERTCYILTLIIIGLSLIKNLLLNQLKKQQKLYHGIYGRWMELIIQFLIVGKNKNITIEATLIAYKIFKLNNTTTTILNLKDGTGDITGLFVGEYDNLSNNNIYKIRGNVVLIEDIKIHDFRHSCASLLINNGANVTMVAKYLGHSKIDETLNTYSHVFQNKLDDIVNTLDNLD